jgi:hypothetical protein
LIFESTLVYIVQRGILVHQLGYSDSQQQWENGDTAANYFANIVAIFVNTLNLTAILSYVVQVIRYSHEVPLLYSYIEQ